MSYVKIHNEHKLKYERNEFIYVYTNAFEDGINWNGRKRQRWREHEKGTN